MLGQLSTYLASWVLPQEKPVSATAKPLEAVLLQSRNIFSAKDGPRKTLKICSESPGNELSEYVLKNMYVVCCLKGIVA